MGSWLVARDSLTLDQIRAVELSTTENRLIVGAPGSGKTLVLAHRCRYLADTMGSTQRAYRILVFTKALREYIRAGTRELHIPDESVTTFGSWVMEFYRANVSPLPPRDARRQIDFDAMTAQVRRYLQQIGRSKPIYDFVLVDEGQDLSDDAYAIITRIARHVTVCMDAKQQLYDDGSSEDAILKHLKIQKKSMMLLEAFRCSPYIADLAAHFIADPAVRTAYLNQVRTRQVARETPLLFVARDFEEERANFIEIVRARLGNGERVIIMLPKKSQVYGFAQALKAAGILVELPDQADFENDVPKIMPFQSGKGLTFDTVLMPRLVQSSFSRVQDDFVQRMFFVGITRATKWVYMSTIAGEEVSAIRPLVDGAAGAAVTVRRGDAERKPQSATRQAEPQDDLLDLL